MTTIYTNKAYRIEVFSKDNYCIIYGEDYRVCKYARTVEGVKEMASDFAEFCAEEKIIRKCDKPTEKHNIRREFPEFFPNEDREWLEKMREKMAKQPFFLFLFLTARAWLARAVFGLNQGVSEKNIKNLKKVLDNRLPIHYNVSTEREVKKMMYELINKNNTMVFNTKEEALAVAETLDTTWVLNAVVGIFTTQIAHKFF